MVLPRKLIDLDPDYAKSVVTNVVANLLRYDPEDWSTEERALVFACTVPDEQQLRQHKMQEIANLLKVHKQADEDELEFLHRVLDIEQPKKSRNRSRTDK